VSLALLSYNIRYGGGGREREIAEVVRASGADLVMFQEAVKPDVVERIAAEAGMEAWAAQAGVSTAFASRVEIARHAWHRPPGSRHPFLEVEPAGAGVKVFGLHLSAVHSNWTERRRSRELRALLELTRPLRGEFHVVAGDFNALAPGETLDWRRLPPRLRVFVWLSGGSIRQETIRLMHDGGYVDGFRSVNGQVEGFTFPTWDPHVRLDYVFVPEAFAGRLALCRVLKDVGAAPRASDHFPLLARIETGA
jgi:exodeoxyribonuclease-3